MITAVKGAGRSAPPSGAGIAPRRLSVVTAIVLRTAMPVISRATSPSTLSENGVEDVEGRGRIIMREKKQGVWEDTTSHSQSDKERIPAEWTLYTLGIRMTIHRHIYEEPDLWFLSVSGSVRLDKVPLRNKDITKAQRESLSMISTITGNIHEAVEAIINK